MKKKILSACGAAGVAAIVCVTILVSNPQKSNAGTISALNTSALVPVKKCGGPKNVDTKTCQSENTIECHDTSGC